LPNTLGIPSPTLQEKKGEREGGRKGGRRERKREREREIEKEFSFLCGIRISFGSTSGSLGMGVLKGRI
jgi:hypothetical protein